MDAVSMGVRLGSAVVGPLVRRLFRQREPGAGLVDAPVRLDALVSFRGEKRTLTGPELERLAGELVGRGLAALGPEGGRLAAEREALTAALAARLSALGDLGMDDVQAVRLGADGLARALAAADRDHLLGADAQTFVDALTRLACLHVIDFFTRRSTFVARTLVAQARHSEQVLAALDVLAERLPDPSAEDGAFEDRYRRYLAGRHGRLTVFGLDLDDDWPLDDAYLHLETRRGGDHAPDDRPAPPQRAEDALRGLERVLLRGVAGSGKTTLVQWLAVTTAEHRLPHALLHLLGRVPFVLPLRTLTRTDRDLPLPADFLRAVGCPHTPPAGWAERVLAAGRGLLLVDGVDEIPEEHRPAARTWLRELLREFPATTLLVTGRPSAVAEDWLAGDGFTELSLSPMSRDDVITFVERWHRAARAGEEQAADLLSAIRGRQDLARLATNPLMCAVMCALHRAGHGYLPHGRAALYDAALRMLLERRDRQRKVRAELTLDAETQTLLLQKLAYWLLRNGHHEIERADAVAVLERVLPAMPQAAAQGDADAVYRHLLERSGLLREPAEGLADFVHRTFQDYLAAREAIEARDIPFVVRNAHRDQWEDVVRMAVAHGRPEERARLLKALVKRGDQTKRHRVRLHLLAMACLEHATQLDPAVRELVTSRAAELLPPRAFEEALALAEVGPVVLELLPSRPEGLSEQQTDAVVETHIAVGGDAALERLVRFCGAQRGRRLASCWRRFDTTAFARLALPLLDPETLPLVTIPEQLRLLPPGRRFRADGVPVEAILDAGLGDVCEELYVYDPCDPLTLRHLTGLRRLVMYAGPKTGNLAAFAGLGLRELFVHLVPDMPLTGLDRLGDLEELHVSVPQGVDPWPLLPPDAPVTHLTLYSDVRDLAALRTWPRLRDVFLGQEPCTLRPADWTHLDAAGVKELNLLPAATQAWLTSGVRLPQTTSLVLNGLRPPADLAQLAVAVPHLERLWLLRPAGIDLRPLAQHPGLTSLHLAKPVDVLGLSELESLEHLGVSVMPAPRYA